MALGTSQAFATGITITGANTTFTATSSNTTIGDVSSGSTFACTRSTIGGSLANVTNAPLPYTTTKADGSPHSITSLTFTGCTDSFGTATLSAGAADLPDDFVFDSPGPDVLRTAGTAGALFSVAVLTCSFNVAGTVEFTWTNGTIGQLKLVGSRPLHPTGISAGCFGLVSSTDTLAWTGTYTVTPPTIMIG
ncbi:MAG TPA: hypothetical protein VFW65_22470 [Pseudonocardiaceae bacterium]|nr:hypothetical protein [Pseudonocardiaceae bacterium]